MLEAGDPIPAPVTLQELGWFITDAPDTATALERLTTAADTVAAEVTIGRIERATAATVLSVRAQVAGIDQAEALAIIGAAFRRADR